MTILRKTVMIEGTKRSKNRNTDGCPSGTVEEQNRWKAVGKG